MTLRWNPFAVVTHNEIRLPRILHHAAHVLIGVVVWLLARFVRVPMWMTIGAAALLATYVKFIWIDWRRRSGRFLHPWVSYTLNAPDFIADLGFTLLGAIVPPVLWWLAYYPLSVISDP